MARILVTEKLADAGLDDLRAAGHEVDVQLGLSPEELVATVPGAAALIIRSATTVTAEVLAAGTDLVVVGRAGIGLDNVDVAAATTRPAASVSSPSVKITLRPGLTTRPVARSTPEAWVMGRRYRTFRSTEV